MATRSPSPSSGTKRKAICRWPSCNRIGVVQVGYVASSDREPRLVDVCAWHRHELRLLVAANRTSDIPDLFEYLTRSDRTLRA